jgi:uncharacterized protein YggT (Ycf19 family)
MDDSPPSTSPPPSTPQPKSNKTYKILYYILGVIEVLLALRFFLLLFGANIDAGFAQLIRVLTDPLMAPFTGLFPVRQGETAIFSFSIIVAMLIYALLFYGIARLIAILSKR